MIDDDDKGGGVYQKMTLAGGKGGPEPSKIYDIISEQSLR